MDPKIQKTIGSEFQVSAGTVPGNMTFQALCFVQLMSRLSFDSREEIGDVQIEIAGGISLFALLLCLFVVPFVGWQLFSTIF